jgi:hypothetical protein
LLFIRSEERKLYNCLVLAQAETRLILKNTTTSLNVWDSTADLWMIHVFTEHNVKTVYANHYKSKTRRDLDGRNAASRENTWLEAIANKYNDP